jgi:protein-disulfide isomerase
MDTAPLIEEVATVKESFAVQPNHIADASKKVDPMPSPSVKHEKTKREILIFVSANCPPCEKWKRCEMQRFMDAGWAVGIVEVHSYGLTPTFEIESGEKKATIKGYTTLEQAAEAMR